MKRLLLLVITLFLLIFVGSFFLKPIFSDELDDLTKKINELQQALDMSRRATAPLETQANSLQNQISGIEKRVAFIETDIERKRREIDQGYRDLAQQKQIFNKTVREYYIKTYAFSPFLIFVANAEAQELTKALAYKKKGANRDKALITSIALKLLDLEERKKKFEAEEKRLHEAKETIATEKAEIEKIVKGAKEYQAGLSRQIAELSARQQEILAQKLGSLNLPTTLGAGPLYCTDDRKIDPGFSPAFAFFTLGIPHRVGMNQYGALGRAQAGQSHEEILQAYYEGITFETKPNINIKVQGYGEMPLEQYLLGIYEMPESWPIEALKAQAIAARSYALSYTNNGEKEICTTQQCQVYKGGSKGGNWETAVHETEGKVMVSGGQAITAWYASTAGGYTFRSDDVGWSPRPWTKRMRDTRGDVGGFQDLFDTAYDKDSPCFYSAQGYRSQYGKSAWLKTEEVSDIINVILLARADSGTREHLYQMDKPNPAGTDTWDAEQVKQELRSRGITPYTSISGIDIEWDKGIGKTTSVSVSGDAGGTSFDASEFRNFFNLRAPASIQIVGPLYNIERK